jgi:hypothetical protein
MLASEKNYSLNPIQDQQPNRNHAKNSVYGFLRILCAGTGLRLVSWCGYTLSGERLCWQGALKIERNLLDSSISRSEETYGDEDLE